MDIKATFDNEAEEYDFTSRAVNIYFDEALDYLAKSIKLKSKDPKILDVCCGTGILTEKIFNRFPNAEIVGVDFSQGILDIAIKRLKNKNFKYVLTDVCDKEKMKDIGRFDLIVSSFGIHNIHGNKNKKLALQNILNLLKKDGLYITCDIVKGKDEKQCEQFENFQKEWLLKTYREKETQDWIDLLREEDEPITLEDNLKMLKNAKLSDVNCIWQKEFLAIWKGTK